MALLSFLVMQSRAESRGTAATSVLICLAGLALIAGCATPTFEQVLDPIPASPLDEFLGDSIWNRQQEFEQESQAWLIRREELVARCMHEAGFEYLPVLTDPSRGAPATNAFDDVHPDDREWVAQYGFGIASGHRSAQSVSVWDVWDDPNQAYVDSLSESEQKAFWLALNGPDDNFPNETWTQTDFENWFETQGCFGQAQTQAINESPLFLQNQDEFAPLFDAIAEMDTDIRNSPEFWLINVDYANCMADAGYADIRNPGEAPLEFVGARYFKAKEAAGVATAEDAAEFAILQQREIEVALADLDCRETINHGSRMAEIRRAVELQFIEDHRAALEAYQAAAAQRD